PAGTLGERYLVSRGLAVPATDDLAFTDDCVDFKTMRGHAAMLALFRRPDGEPAGGIHRIYLNADGTKHSRKMLGVTDGAVVMLGQPQRGLLGIAEGIETTLA